MTGDTGDTGDAGDAGDVGGLMTSPRLSGSYLPGAMLTTHDGIVGTWNPPQGQPGMLEPDDPNAMPRWEPWVRRQVIGFELLSLLRFASAGTTAAASGTISAGSDDLVTIFRPTPEMIRKDQLPHVFSYADLRRDRASEIQAQISEFFPFFASVCDLHPNRSPFTLELLTALRFVVVATQMRVKHALAMPRPVDYGPQALPMIQTPGHSSFPAGHAVETFMFATVLAELAAGREQQLLYPLGRPLHDQLMRLAARISVNRVVAGVHFPVDLAAGMVLGSQLGRYFVALAKGSTGPFWSWTFDAGNYGDEDFPWRDMIAAIENNQPSLIPPGNKGPFLTSGSQFTVPRLPPESPMRWLFDRAAEEWRVLP